MRIKLLGYAVNLLTVTYNNWHFSNWQNQYRDTLVLALSLLNY